MFSRSLKTIIFPSLFWIGGVVCTVIQLYWQAVRGTDNTTAWTPVNMSVGPGTVLTPFWASTIIINLYTTGAFFDINSQRIFVLTVCIATHRQNCVLHLESDEGAAPGARTRSRPALHHPRAARLRHALPLHHDPALRRVVDPQQLRRDSRPRVFRASVRLSLTRKR